MPADIILPQWGMGMNDGTVVRWLKQIGDPVTKGDPLVEIESAKVNSEVEATTEGKLGQVIVQEGTTVNVGTVLGRILREGETDRDLPPTGSLESASLPPRTADGPTPSVPRPVAGRVVATPRARRLAQQLNVDIESMAGTGPSGRVTEDDVRQAAEAGPAKGAPTPAPSGMPVREVIKLSGIRGTIARRMAQSASAPTVTLNTHADVTPAIDVQRELLSRWRSQRIRPQYQDLVIAAVARSLKEVPFANAHLVGDEVRVLEDINLGIAVAIPEGLLVPVIKNADQKSPLELAIEVRELARAAKEHTLKPDQMAGSTFSITNLGAYDVEAFDPLLNPPEIGILGLGRVEERPAVISGEITIRSIGHLSLTFDHRAWDGAPAAEFLRTVVGRLKEPSWLLD